MKEPAFPCRPTLAEAQYWALRSAISTHVLDTVDLSVPGVPDDVAVPKTSLPEVEPLPRREPSQKISAMAEQERKRSEQMRQDFEASMSRLAEQDAMRASKSVLDHERRAQQEQERVAQRERLQKQEEAFWAELQMQDEEARVRREKMRQEQSRLIWEDDARERKNIKIKQKTAFYEFQETAHISAREHLEQALQEISSAIRAEEDELMNYGTKQTLHVEQGRDPQLKVKAIADEAEEILMLEEEGGAEEWTPALVPLQEQLQELARVRLLQKRGSLVMGRGQPDLYPALSQFEGTSGEERPFHPTPREVLDQLESEEHARLRELDSMLSSQSSLYPRESSLAAGQTEGDNRSLVAQPEQDQPRERKEEERHGQEEEKEEKEEEEPEARDAAEQGIQRVDSNGQDTVEMEGGGAEGEAEGAAFQGDIDFETFACMSINQGIPREELRAIFDGLDVDKNGVLDVVEFSRYTARKATYELRAGMRVKVGGLEAGRREAEYNGKTGSIVRQGQCSKWIVAVDVVKQSDSAKTRKKRRSTDKDGAGKVEDKATDGAGKEKARTKDKAKAVPRKQTVLLKLHSNYITPVDAKPAVPEGETGPLSSWPALARPSPPPPAAAPRVELSPEKARQADELVFDKLETMRARAAMAQADVDAVAAVTARGASEEPAAQLPDDEGLHLSKAGEDDWCCAQVEACLVKLALARDRLHGLKQLDAAGDGVAESAQDAPASLSEAQAQVAACEKGFFNLLRHDWGQGKGAIEDRQHWVGIGVATSSSAPFVVLSSSYRLSFADADSSLFEGDVILAFNDVLTENLGWGELSWLMRGPSGTAATVCVLRDESKLMLGGDGDGSGVVVREVRLVRQPSHLDAPSASGGGLGAMAMAASSPSAMPGKDDEQALPAGCRVRVANLRRKGSKYNGHKGYVLVATGSGEEAGAEQDAIESPDEAWKQSRILVKLDSGKTLHLKRENLQVRQQSPQREREPGAAGGGAPRDKSASPEREGKERARSKIPAYDPLSSFFSESFSGVSGAFKTPRGSDKAQQPAQGAKSADVLTAGMVASFSTVDHSGSGFKGKKAVLKDILGRGTNEERVKKRDIELLRAIAENRAKGYLISADQVENQLTDHLQNSREMAATWGGLGLKLSSSAPYRIQPASGAQEEPDGGEAVAGGGAGEAAGFDTILAVEGIDLSNLNKKEVRRLILGPEGMPLSLTVARSDEAGGYEARDIKVVRARGKQGGDGVRAEVDSDGHEATFFGLQVLSQGDLRLIPPLDTRNAASDESELPLQKSCTESDLLLSLLHVETPAPASAQKDNAFGILDNLGAALGELPALAVRASEEQSRELSDQAAQDQPAAQANKPDIQESQQEACDVSIIAQGDLTAAQGAEAQARLELPTPTLVADFFSALSTGPQPASGPQLQQPDADAAAMSFFGLPVKGATRFGPSDAQDKAKIERRLKDREKSLLQVLATARELGKEDEARKAQTMLEDVLQNFFYKEAKADWKGLGIKISQSPPFVIESHWGGAQTGGTRDGDVITAVDEINLHSLKLVEVQTLLRGPAGSEVTLSILRSDQEGQLEKMDMTVKRNEELGRIRRSKAREDAQEQLKARKEEEFTARQKMASQEAKQAAESESSGLSFFGLPVASVRHAHEKSLVKSPETLERDLLTDAHLSSPKAQQRTHKAEERMLIDALAAARESFDPSDLAASQAQVARAEDALTRALLANRIVAQEWVGLGIKLAGEAAPYKIDKIVASWGRDTPPGQEPIVGDTILAVDGVSLRSLKLAEVRALLRGPLDSSVRLTVSRLDPTGAADILDLMLVRSKVQQRQQYSSVSDLMRAGRSTTPLESLGYQGEEARMPTLPIDSSPVLSTSIQGGELAFADADADAPRELEMHQASMGPVGMDDGVMTDPLRGEESAEGQRFVDEELLQEIRVPSFEEQLEWRYAEDDLMLNLVRAREDSMIRHRNQDALALEDEDVGIECEKAGLEVTFFQRMPEQQEGRLGWCGVGLIIEAGPHSFFVAAVADARCVSHQQPDAILVDDELISISGLPTLLLTLSEVEALLMGPEGSTVVLQISSPRFPDSTSNVELLRHSSPGRQALI